MYDTHLPIPNDLEALERESSRRQAVSLGRCISRLRMCNCNTEALHPFLRVLTVLRLQDKCLVSREDLECLRDVSCTAGYFYRTNLIYVDAFATTRSLAGQMCPGEREVASPPAPEEAPAALLLLELALDDGRAVGRQEAHRALRVRAQEAAPRRLCRRQSGAVIPSRHHFKHVEEACCP